MMLPRKVPKPRAYLTLDQVELLASNVGEHSTLVYFLSYTGLRWGEATAIRIRSVDTVRRRIRIDENAVRVGTAMAIGTTKTHEARSVPVPGFLLEKIVLASQGTAPEDLLFGFANIHLLRPHTWHGWFARAVDASRAADPTFPKVTIHDLRHTAAGLAISAGANVKAVQRMLGHASAAMTLDTYADLFDDDLNAVSDRLDDVRSRRMSAKN
jgi:integrase